MYHAIVNEGSFTHIRKFTQLDKVYNNKAFNSLSALQKGLLNGNTFRYERSSEFSYSGDIYLPEIKQIATSIFENYTAKYQKNRCYICRAVDYIKESLGFQTQRSRVTKIYNEILNYEGREQSSTSFSSSSAVIIQPITDDDLEQRYGTRDSQEIRRLQDEKLTQLEQTMKANEAQFRELSESLLKEGKRSAAPQETARPANPTFQSPLVAARVESRRATQGTARRGDRLNSLVGGTSRLADTSKSFLGAAQALNAKNE